VLKRIGAILAGFVAWWGVVGLATLLVRAVWPAYAAAEPLRAYTLDMLLTRLTTGMVATLVAGAVVAWLSKRELKAVLWFGGVLLLLSAVHHYRIWDQYPVWYHLVYLAYLVPLTVLGARLVRSQTPE
jgi:hypothetical protein